jgi:ketosteroid isomerase-like protein
MSNQEHTRSSRASRWVGPVVVALSMAAVPLTVAHAAGTGDTESAGVEDIVAEALHLDQQFVALWNDDKFDEMGTTYYTDDALAVPPNHAPIKGRKAIIEYMKSLRPLGELSLDPEPIRAVGSNATASLVNTYYVGAARTRVTAHELFQRQPDGTLKCTVDMFGFHDPLR